MRWTGAKSSRGPSGAAAALLDERQERVERTGVRDEVRLDPGATGDRRAPDEVLPLGRVVRIRIDREAAARLARDADALVIEIQAVLRAVDLQERPGLGGAAVEPVPIEVEVGTPADLPPRGVGEDVDVRAAQRDLVTRHQLLAWLAPPDVERGDDDVEPL